MLLYRKVRQKKPKDHFAQKKCPLTHTYWRAAIYFESLLLEKKKQLMKGACTQSWVFGPQFLSTDSVNEKWT